MEGDKLTKKQEITVRGEVNSVAYDTSGERLALSGSSRYVEVLETESYGVCYLYILSNDLSSSFL